MRLNEMRAVLAERGIQLSKSLGQNFLHDQNQLRRIVSAAEVCGKDRVLEIGPGLGPLTELLLENAGEVLAIEKDARLAGFLRERYGNKKLKLLDCDAVKFLKAGGHDWRDWKVVSNLPYSAASPILVELACGRRAPERIVATLQLEVARRLTARAGDKDYGVLTLLMQLDFTPRPFFKIPASCFYPEPDVDSACVVLDRRQAPVLAEDLRAGFVKIVKRAFSQRRKMAFKLLKEDWAAEELDAAFTSLNLSRLDRGEQFSLEQFVKLTKMLK